MDLKRFAAFKIIIEKYVKIMYVHVILFIFRPQHTVTLIMSLKVLVAQKIQDLY